MQCDAKLELRGLTIAACTCKQDHDGLHLDGDRHISWEASQTLADVLRMAAQPQTPEEGGEPGEWTLRPLDDPYEVLPGYAKRDPSA